MTSILDNIDINHPRGWGELGQTGDACEHGHQITETDIENLKKHYGLEISYHTINGNKYKLISLLQTGATDTVVSILGGDGKYYVINSDHIPNGLIMPFTEYCKIKKLNLVIVDPDHPLEHAWFVRVGPLKDQDKGIWASNSNLATQQKLRKWLQMAREFYIKNHKILSEDFFSKNKILHDVHTFIKDLKEILEYIKNITNTNLWLMGHCSGANMISYVYDTDQYNHLYKGIIFLSPFWKKNWRVTGLNEMKYFLTSVTKPILIIQHAEDPCVGTHPDIAKKIISDINTPITRYVELEGGIDQGCPHFSLGYHGYRGIEHKVIDEIDRFIVDHDKT